MSIELRKKDWRTEVKIDHKETKIKGFLNLGRTSYLQSTRNRYIKRLMASHEERERVIPNFEESITFSNNIWSVRKEPTCLMAANCREEFEK